MPETLSLAFVVMITFPASAIKNGLTPAYVIAFVAPTVYVAGVVPSKLISKTVAFEASLAIKVLY